MNLSNSRRCILFFFFRYLAGEELDNDDSDQESDDDDNDDLDNPEDCTCLEDTSTSRNHQSQVDQLKSKIEARTRVLNQNSPQQLVPQFVDSMQKPSPIVHAVHPQPVGAAVTQVYRCDQDGCGKICKSVGGLLLHKNRMHNGKKNI